MSKWFTGLFLLFIVVVVYEFMSPIIDTTLPNNLPTSSLPYQAQVFDSTKSSFLIGMIGLALAYLLYIFIGGLPGQQEDFPIV